MTSFIGGTYLAISIEPLSIVVSVLLCCVCITIFVIYAPIETDKHPISEQRKSLFKKAIIITTIALFIFSLCMGETVYRNLIIIGVMLEAYIMLPPIKKIIK